LIADFAQAQGEILRIRAIRTDQWTNIGLGEGHDHDPNDLKRLAALDRYERYALTKRRRALQRLIQWNAGGSFFAKTNPIPAVPQAAPMIFLCPGNKARSG
jgi:hypothetical protein